MKQSRLEESAYVSVQFVCPLMDNMEALDNMSSNWGLTIMNADRDKSAFIPVGTRDQFEKKFMKHDEDPVKFAVSCLMNSIDELGDELFNEIVENEEGFLLNGELVGAEEFMEVYGSFGEKEGERIKEYKKRMAEVESEE